MLQCARAVFLAYRPYRDREVVLENQSARFKNGHALSSGPKKIVRSNDSGQAAIRSLRQADASVLRFITTLPPPNQELECRMIAWPASRRVYYASVPSPTVILSAQRNV